MKTKILIAFLWIFYIAVRNTGEIIWRFCLIYSGILMVCAFLYQLENRQVSKKRGKKR